jgi:NAD(P)-dependent dehydrogenase (short-subunit alcohol dehydrogenase family)
MSSSIIILITGANTGLGLETVKSLLRSEAGKVYTILLGGRDLNKANDAARSAKKEYPDSKTELVPVQIDLEDDESIKKLHERIEKEFRRVDVLINNGGEPLPPTRLVMLAGSVLACCILESVIANTRQELNSTNSMLKAR